MFLKKVKGIRKPERLGGHTQKAEYWVKQLPEMAV